MKNTTRPSNFRDRARRWHSRIVAGYREDKGIQCEHTT